MEDIVTTVECVLAITSAPKSLDVIPFVEELVKSRLAACVKVLPAGISVFCWKNKFEIEHEQIVVIKTTVSRVRELEKRIQVFHPDEVPEFIVLPIIDGNADYLKWIKESTASLD